MNAVTSFGDIAARLRNIKNGEVTIPCNQSRTVKDNKAGMAMLLAYQTGDRCIYCGGAAFDIRNHTAQCTNPRCEMPVPLALA